MEVLTPTDPFSQVLTRISLFYRIHFAVAVTDLQNSRENAASRPVVGSWIASPGPYCGVEEQSHYGLRRAFCWPRSRRGPRPAAAPPAPLLEVRLGPPAERRLGPTPLGTSPRRQNVRPAPALPMERSRGARRPGDHSRPAIPAPQPAGPRGRALGSLWITSSR